MIRQLITYITAPTPDPDPDTLAAFIAAVESTLTTLAHDRDEARTPDDHHRAIDNHVARLSKALQRAKTGKSE